LITRADLARLLPDFLPRQRWYGAGDRQLESVDVIDCETLRDEWPVLVWALAEARFEDGGRALYQVPVGLRPLEEPERFLEGKGRGVLGDHDTPDGPALVYDALVDPELTLALLSAIAPDEPAEHARALNVEQSNTSVIFDERLIMKLFRRVHEGPNPDVEVTEALAGVGFTHISAPVASWRRDDRDLAVVREFLSGATDGWHLALTSLRDLYGSRIDPSEAGGDFAPEAERLGAITAEMHVALAEAFGTEPGDPAAWAGAMDAHLHRVPSDDFDARAVAAAYERLTSVDDPGVSMRVHGDLHLGQTMRTDTGWYVLDFEGEPALPLVERRQASSPLRDVAGMLRSFHYASQSGLIERGVEIDDELAHLGDVWERRSTDAFLDGYWSVDGVADLTPRDESARAVVLDAFLLSKAVYEVGYEAANRPTWVGIPLTAVHRLLDAVGPRQEVFRP
jgi:maltokinase